MKDTQEALQVQLRMFFDLHRSRLNCICYLIMSLLQLGMVNLAALFFSLNDATLSASNDKRLQRFFPRFASPYDCLSLWIWKRFAQGELFILVFDRTNPS